MVKIVEEPHPEDSVNFLQPAKLYESDYSSGEDNTVAVIENTVEKIEPLNMPIKIGNIKSTLLVDSGSVCSIPNRSLKSQVVQSRPCAFWISEKTYPQLRNFSNEPIQVEEKIQFPITSNGWTCDSESFTVVAGGLKSLIGRDLFDQLGLAATQSTSQKGNRVNNISSPEFKEQIAKTFSELISRIGRSKNHVAKSTFHKDFQSSHQKVRRIPINLQEKVNNELKKLLDKKHIINFSSCPDKYFISLIVVTVKKDQTIKLALDSKVLNKVFHKNKVRRIPINLQEKVNNELKKFLDKKHIINLSSCPDKYFISLIVVTVKKFQTIKLALDSKVLNKAFHKNKYQMPKIDTLIESISQQFSASVSQNTIYFSILDLKYAYSQLNLDTNTANHCNFNIISGDMTGTC